MLASTRLVVLLSMSLLACKAEKAAVPPPEPPSAPGDPSLFVIARPSVTRMALPARFAGPLPASVDEIDRPTSPPRPYIRAALAADTDRMRQRFVDALSRAAAAGPIPEQLAGFYTDVVWRGPEVCGWLAGTGANPALPAAAREAAWMAARHCDDASFGAAIVRDDVPDIVIVEWYFNQHGDDELPFSERVARAAANVARTSKGDYDVRRVGFVFARMKSAASIRAISKLQAELPDAHRRALAGLGMLRSKSPAGQAIGKRSCEHPKVAIDPMCRPAAEAFPGQPGKPTDLAGLVDHGEDPRQLLASFPRAAVLSALTTCAQTGAAHRGPRCFEHLVDLDRAAALVLARQLVTSDDARTAQMARSLLEYPDAGSAEKALVDLGFELDKARERGDEPEAEERPPVTLQDVLVVRGRSEWFDTETDMFPNEHDGLLAKLARLARPALDAVVFEEIPPGEEEMDSGPYMLHAYVDGVRYSLAAENRGDWYDVEAVIGLLNALLVARKSDRRLVVLQTGDQSTIVVAGPASGLESLADSRLIDIADTREAERIGKGAEDRAVEELQKGGHEPVLRDVRAPTP